MGIAEKAEELPRLEYLRLRGRGLDTEDFAAIDGEFPALGTLNVAGTSIGDDFSSILAKLPELVLMVVDDTRMTCQGYHNLKEVRPMLVVHKGFRCQ